MSLPPRILCRAGCGDVGDPELGYVCIDCHGDRVDAQRDRELQRYIAAKNAAAAAAAGEVGNDGAAAVASAEAEATSPPGATVPPPKTTRRGPPSINHQRALLEFLERPREKDAGVVSRENQFLARELEIRETSKAQLRKYMIATDEGEPVDPKEWSRYTYGAPRDVPRHDVDEATELAAQLKLFCLWRKRTMRVRAETRRRLQQEVAEAERAKRGRLKLSLAALTGRKFSGGGGGGSGFGSASASMAQRRETLTNVLQKLAPARRASEKPPPEASKRASLLAAAWPKAKSNVEAIARTDAAPNANAASSETHKDAPAAAAPEAATK